MSTCPRCTEEVAGGQEYCLECGVRLPGPGPVGVVDDPGGGWARRAAAALVVAVVGGVAAVVATGGAVGGTDPQLLTATGGFATTPTTGTLPAEQPSSQAGIRDWPAGQNGWTIALASLPQTGGKRPAVRRARDAGAAGLDDVGVLDSSRYASLHSGYWVVFAGVYGSEAEATSALQPARAFARTATVRRIVQ